MRHFILYFILFSLFTSNNLFSQRDKSEKDPLFTAGIVGNLDRQKIGHTSMGSNKNSHLFGDR